MNIYNMTREKRAEYRKKLEGYIALIDRLEEAEGTEIGRRCTKCRNVKPLGEFYSNPRYCDGYSTRCRKCLCKAQRIWSAKNAEYLISYRKARK